MKASHFLVRQESGKEVSALVRLAPPISPSAKPGRPVTRWACVASRPKFAALILGPRSQTRPLPGFARHFAFSETGQAGHTLRVCCFAPKIRRARSGAPLANPALMRLAPPISPLAKPGRPGIIGASRMKQYEFASCWHWNSYFSGGRNPQVLCCFFSIRKQDAFS